MDRDRLLKLVGVALLMLVVIVGESCIDDRYDMDNLSDGIHLFDNGINIPLGSSDKIGFTDYVEENENVKVREDGIYMIESHEETTTISQPATPVQIDELSLVTTETPSIFISGALSTGETAEVTLPESISNISTQISLSSYTVAEEITDVKSITASIPMTISFDVTNAIGGDLTSIDIDQLRLEGYTIQLPQEFVFSDSRVDGDNKMVISETLNRGGDGFTITVTAIGIDNVEFNDGIVKLNTSMEMGESGTVTLLLNGNGVYAENIKLKSDVELQKFWITNVMCKIDIPIPDKTVEYVGDVPSFLKENQFFISNPMFLSEIVNNSSITAYVDVEIIPYDSSGEILKNEQDESIIISLSELLVEANTSEMFCQAIYEDDYYTQLGYKYIYTPELEKLRGLIPHSISVQIINIEPVDEYVDIDLYEDKMVDIKSQLNIPLIFEATTECEFDTYVVVETLLESSGLDEFIIKATFSNKVPAQMQVLATFFDSYGEELTNLDIEIDGFVEASPTITATPDIIATESKVQINVKELVEGEIMRISTIEFDFDFFIMQDKTPITEYQNIGTKVSLYAPNGIDK